MLPDIAWPKQRHAWPCLKNVVVIDSVREIAGVATEETRLYITSLDLQASAVGPVVRSHWVIENSLHWVLDMTFRDDECRVRTDHAPANFNAIKHMALNLIRRGKGKLSVNLARHSAAWDDEFLVRLISG